MLAAGITFPSIPALYEIPVLGPVITQAYEQLPSNLKTQIPANVRAQLAPPAKPRPGTPAANTQAQLEALNAEVLGRHEGRATISVAGAGMQMTAGDNRPEPAFSTMKVPTAIFALRTNPEMYADAEAAITQSDNDATARLAAVVPGVALDAVIAEAGSRTSNTAAWRMGTLWTTSDQAQFASGLRCVAGHEPALEMMGRIAPHQRWGLGRIPGAKFKGGWNYYEDGHLARQFGLIPGPGGDIAVAITAYSPHGHTESFAMLDELADGIAHLRGQLPAARC